MSRIDEIRARLDALTASDSETCRIADFYGLADPVSEACPRCDVHRHAEGDIAWLMEEVERLQEIEKNREKLGAKLRDYMNSRDCDGDC